MTKFKLGDQVRVIKYGSIMQCHPDELDKWDQKHRISETEYDICPEVVGQTGIIRTAQDCQGNDTYAIEGTTKCAWFDNEQLELVYRPEYIPL